MIPFRKSDAGDWFLLALIVIAALWVIAHAMGWAG